MSMRDSRSITLLLLHSYSWYLTWNQNRSTIVYLELFLCSDSTCIVDPSRNPRESWQSLHRLVIIQMSWWTSLCCSLLSRLGKCWIKQTLNMSAIHYETRCHIFWNEVPYILKTSITNEVINLLQWRFFVKKRAFSLKSAIFRWNLNILAGTPIFR